MCLWVLRSRKKEVESKIRDTSASAIGGGPEICDWGTVGNGLKTRLTCPQSCHLLQAHQYPLHTLR